MKIKKKDGITLVALVVTIVVLLILAGITLSLVLGENGIINKAKEAKDTTIQDEKNTQIAFDVITNEINESLGLPTIESAKDDNMLNKEKNTTITVRGNKVTIPAGFKVSEDSADSVEGGIVIEDASGNQFVWIPVGTVRKSDGTSVEITLGRYTFDKLGVETLQQDSANYSEIKEITGNYQELATPRISDGSTTNTTALSLEKFVTKTNKMGGYYLARYEASYASGSSIEDYKPYSKPSQSTTMSFTEGDLWNKVTQADAATISRNMYSGNKNITSDLVNSYAWDTAIVFIQKCSDKTNYSIAKQTENSNLIANTGKNTNDIACNIYNMASNLLEWTTEYCNKIINGKYLINVERGGVYNNTGSRTVSSRKNRDIVFETIKAPETLGFRTILYFN